MTVELVYEPRLAEYRLSDSHPLRPERFVLAFELMRAWGLFCEPTDERPVCDRTGCATLVTAELASTEDLARVHDEAYIGAVRAAGADPDDWRGAFGIGAGDTPAFAEMHEASARVVGETIRALDDVVAGRCTRAFGPAGGLHHAHRDHAAGFCVYNDPAVAIARALAADPTLRVAYIDVDAHHGDGVQEAFYKSPHVLTISLHESGRYLFPGTGRTVEIGEGPGEGFAVNMPMAPGATDAVYARAIEGVVVPAVRAFRPSVIVAGLGADTHLADPLTHLSTTVEGQYRTAVRLTKLADEVCRGRIVAIGGGGYDSFSAVPRAWACVLAALLGVPVPAELPESWRSLAEEAAERAGTQAQFTERTFDEPASDVNGPDRETEWALNALSETERMIDKLHAEHPLFRDAG